MRIIAGNFKGKKILEPRDKSTRPLKDLAKESLFNIIHHSNKLTVTIKGSYILDLFSGVGSFGLECLSRGASFVTFAIVFTIVFLSLIVHRTVIIDSDALGSISAFISPGFHVVPLLSITSCFFLISPSHFAIHTRLLDHKLQ